MFEHPVTKDDIEGRVREGKRRAWVEYDSFVDVRVLKDRGVNVRTNDAANPPLQRCVPTLVVGDFGSAVCTSTGSKVQHRRGGANQGVDIRVEEECEVEAAKPRDASLGEARN